MKWLIKGIVGVIIIVTGLWFLTGFFNGVDPVIFLRDRIHSVLKTNDGTPYEVTTNPEQQMKQAEEFVDQKLQNVQKNIQSKYSHLKEYHVPGKIIQWFQSIFQDETEYPPLEKIPVKLVRVVDGDTIIVLQNNKELTVRFLNVDTPESVKKDTPVQPYALDAKKFTEQQLTAAQQIHLVFDKGPQKDNYGRYLAYVFVDNNLLQQLLVQEGLARVTNIQSENQLYLSVLNETQEIVKTTNKGIWSIPNYVQMNGFRN
ncbi:thermonuclease family protein [Enterococcus cecorum]|uniref:TNase-like domain-containing protein n=1 Tax=Enterococcus cecorum TaxID=44008 RepID=A0A7X9NKD3_9ENTE|nr:thermonuclease family protein [Enterococcus cecorum]MCJ0577888.1 thermonuclease family protein [Enterococcus cecorum]MCJ0583194.1 thermonuclease family protein [Enterococcus cecorum]MCJ0585800.1 thermonuclease family protein [Enterococcus cecorum]MDZ5439608.1 thermonuclease family protein [Enterococcus cecorum]MDZ5497660.1 thermonuclease family protein [Enterococcus cecorum]